MANNPVQHLEDTKSRRDTPESVVRSFDITKTPARPLALNCASGSRGFTLIEIMVVIAIIGGLVALVIVRYTHPLAIGKIAASEMELKQVAAALDTYRADHHQYPPDLAGGAITPALFGGANNSYMNNSPKDAGGGSIVYWTNGYGIPTGDYSIGTSTVWDGATLAPFMGANGTSTPPAAGLNYRIIYQSNIGLFANGPM
jgi:general secretion pathway protein G